MKLFINYADKSFYESQNIACKSALTFGFDDVIAYKRNDIDLQFLNENEKIIDSIINLEYHSNDVFKKYLLTIDRYRLINIIEWCEYYYYMKNKKTIFNILNF